VELRGFERLTSCTPYKSRNVAGYGSASSSGPLARRIPVRVVLLQSSAGLAAYEDARRRGTGIPAARAEARYRGIRHRPGSSR